MQKVAISAEWGVDYRVFFPRAPSTIDAQAFSYFTVNRCFKAKVVFNDDLLFAVGRVLAR